MWNDAARTLSIGPAKVHFRPDYQAFPALCWRPGQNAGAAVAASSGQTVVYTGKPVSVKCPHDDVGCAVAVVVWKYVTKFFENFLGSELNSALFNIMSEPFAIRKSQPGSEALVLLAFILSGAAGAAQSNGILREVWLNIGGSGRG